MVNLLNNKKDIYMKTKEIVLPENWEVKEVVDNRIILKEKEKEFPKTWEECVRRVDNIEMIDGCSDIEEYNMTEQIEGGHVIDSSDYGFVPAGLGRPMLALCQLLICRNAWWKFLGVEAGLGRRRGKILHNQCFKPS